MMMVMFIVGMPMATAGTAVADGDGRLPRGDAAFLDMAVQGDQFEVRSGRLADE